MMANVHTSCYLSLNDTLLERTADQARTITQRLLGQCREAT
jgi:hypothetical protein